LSLKPPSRKFSQIPLDIKTVRAKDLYRVSRHSSGEPYFGKTASNRFDDRSKPKKNRFGTCYFGLDLETAIAETVLHDEMPIKGTFSIAYTEIDSRYLVKFRSGTLNLANLTGISLKTMGGHGSLSTIIPYNLPQLWAMAVHRHPQCVDGIYYMSRHLNDRPAVVVFERAKSKLANPSANELIHVSEIMKAVKALHISFIA
jgi:hypothetical protein